MRDLTRALCLTLFCLGLAACSKTPAPEAAGESRPAYLVAVNKPLQYFATRLLGPGADVRMLAPADGDPAMWRPAVEDIQQLQGADLILLNGAGYSPWLNAVSLPDNHLVVSAPDRSRWIAEEGQVTHSHGPEGDHAHGNYAFTTWMDLTLAAEQAGAVSLALQQRYPASAAAIAEREQALVAELLALDADFAAAAAALQGRPVIYSHPVYQYFEARYGLPGLSLHWEPDDMPEEGQWAALQRSVTGNTLFVWEAAPQVAIDERLAALGVQQVTLDPGANHDGDWLALQRQNLEALQRAAAE